MNPNNRLTTNQGTPVGDNQNSLQLGNVDQFNRRLSFTGKACSL